MNYVSALHYGTGGDLYRTWWLEADERVLNGTKPWTLGHVIVRAARAVLLCLAGGA